MFDCFTQLMFLSSKVMLVACAATEASGKYLYHVVAGVFVTEFVFVFALQLCAASGSQKDSGKWSKVKPASDSQG